MDDRGLTHEEFKAVMGLVALPDIPPSDKPIPALFNDAVKAVAACRTINEAKYWENRSDALAAWAKIYSDDDAMREARALKLHAYRRMAALAEELRPKQFRGRAGVVGPHSLLVEHGFSRCQAQTILKIGRIGPDRFEQAVNCETPPSPTTLVDFQMRPNPEWAVFAQRFQMILAKARKTDPDIMASQLSEKHTFRALQLCAELMGWLRRFEAALKAKEAGRRAA